MKRVHSSSVLEMFGVRVQKRPSPKHLRGPTVGVSKTLTQSAVFSIFYLVGDKVEDSDVDLLDGKVLLTSWSCLLTLQSFCKTAECGQPVLPDQIKTHREGG